jgi:hypothetical protein
MGDGFKTFQVGEVLGADDVNGYLMRQSIASFASGVAVLAGITAPEEGQVAYIRDADAFWYYDGTEWREIIFGNAWFPYTPAWTASTSNPTLGNGSIAGRYMRSGKSVFFAAEVITGSTTTYGSGNYSLSLPIAPRTTTPTQYVQSRVGDASSGQAYAGQSGALVDTPSPGAAPIQVQGAADLDNVTPTSPITFATGDQLRLFGMYEAA